MKEINKAIINVMKSVKGMEKSSKVGTGKNQYNGTKDQDVKEVFNTVLAENGLCILPIGIDEETQVDRWIDPQYKNQKQSVFTKVKTKYLLIHESGESIELAGYGHGVDSQDKGAGKATTYALKNCLLYSFLTPVGKIDDTDSSHSEELETPAPARKTLIVNSKEFQNGLTKNKSLDEMKKYYFITEQVAVEYKKQLK